MKIVTVDVVILGAGINGCSAAYWLQKRGKSVLVLSKGVDGIATPAAGGMLTPSAEAESSEQVLLEFATENCAVYPEFIRMLESESQRSCELNMNGTPMPALSNDDRARLEHLAERQEQLGVDTTWLSKKECRDFEPCLSPKVLGGLWAPNDNSVNRSYFLSLLKLRP